MTVTFIPADRQPLTDWDRRGRLLRAVDNANADFLADGGNLEDVATLTMMAQETARYVETLQRLARLLKVASEGTPAHSHSWLRDVIAEETVAEHYRLSPCAARVFTAAVEAA